MLLLASGAAPDSAEVQAKREREFNSVWLVQPSEVPLGIRTIKNNDFVLKQRLLPPSLIRVRTDALDSQTGKVIAAAGTQLFGLSTDGPPIFCITGVRDATFVKTLLIGGGNRQICLVDMDRDGSLDGHFGVGNVIKGLPNISGRRPKTPKPVKGGAYDSLRPDQIEVEYFVGAQYRGNANLGGNHVFEIRYGSAEQTGSLTDRLSHKETQVPGSMEILGGRFTILEAGSGTIRVQVDQTFPAQRFGVIQTTTFRVY
jgi:hypothetical protein